MHWLVDAKQKRFGPLHVLFWQHGMFGPPHG
jgi:hypothetical protein